MDHKDILMPTIPGMTELGNVITTGTPFVFVLTADNYTVEINNWLYRIRCYCNFRRASSYP